MQLGLAYGYLLLAVGFAVYVRVRLLGLPFERDEGEYAYAGQLMLNGIPPYMEAWNMKLPGTYCMYALFMGLFGQSIAGVHAGLLVVNLISVALIFLIGKKLVNPMVGAIAGASYAVLSVVPGTYGLAAHATHFIVLFGLGGVLMLLYALENQRLWQIGVSGLLLGMAFVMKQHAVFLMLFGGVVLLINEMKKSPRAWSAIIKNLSVFGLFAVLPYLTVLVVVWGTGNFEHFWLWTVKYAGAYISIRTSGEAARHFLTSFDFVSDGAGWLWALGAVGLVALFFTGIHPRSRQFLWLFAFFSFLCLIPGLYFRNHYFIALMPAWSLLMGVAVLWLGEQTDRLKTPFARHIPLGLFAGLLLLSMYAGRDIYFKKTTTEVCAWLYGRNPFAEAVEVSKFLKDNTVQTDKIAVIGSEPQIYFYSQRKSATGFIYTYPLMENQPYSLMMQEWMIREIEANKPKYLVFVDSPFSWLANQNSNQFILNWFDNYSTTHYNLVGFADMIAPGNTKYVWQEALPYYRVQGQASVSVFERKN